MLLPEGFRHVGDGRLDVGDEHLQKVKVQKDISEIYDIEATWFAKGKYGIVRRAVCKKTGTNYAAKFLRRRRRGQCCLREINHEIAVLMMCADSNHIVKLHAVHETRSEIALILELATGGELQTVIDNSGSLTEAKTRICMREVLKALQHLHKQSIAHLDLKPQNILLLGDEIEDGLKLCDFGIARVVAETDKIYEILGTPDYVAPEVLQYEPLSLKTDIWSIGVLSYVLLTGCSPFGADDKQETFLNITKCLLTFPDDLFEGVSPLALDFIKSTLRIKPRDRLTVTDCLKHPWFTLDETLDITIQVVSTTNSISSIEEIDEKSKLLGKQSSQKVEEKEEEDDNNKENLVQQQPQPQSQQSSVPLLFPDAPTTPKVSRKAPPESNAMLPNAVKTFVQKFQQQHHHHHHTNLIETVVESVVVDSFCGLNCLKCGGESVVTQTTNTINARKSLQCDKGIIC